MAQFKPNQPVTQADPVVNVEVGPDNALPIGANRFQLVVVDDEGNLSDPAIIEVIVKDVGKPTAVIDVVNADKVRVDPVVIFGKSFILSGGRSSDVEPGKVVEYRFTLLGPA